RRRERDLEPARAELGAQAAVRGHASRDDEAPRAGALGGAERDLDERADRDALERGGHVLAAHVGPALEELRDRGLEAGEAEAEAVVPLQWPRQVDAVVVARRRERRQRRAARVAEAQEARDLVERL